MPRKRKRVSPIFRESSSAAFTLIELLIVIAIILILIAIALPNFIEAQNRARVTTAKANQRGIKTALARHRCTLPGSSSHRKHFLHQRPQNGHTTDPAAVARIRELTGERTDQQVAQILNAEGYRTGRGKAFTTESVAHIRQRRGLAKSSGQRTRPAEERAP